MNRAAENELTLLRSDFQSVTGSPFSNFYCPILFRDELTPLCKGHIVNQAFPGIKRPWTIQREDVDGFFGAHFEADFVDIQHRNTLTADKSLVDRKLWSRFRPQILVRGARVPFYPSAGRSVVPPDQSPVEIETPYGTAKLNLKLSREIIEETQSGDWEISIEKDMRLPALVSLIKSAHLTLFKMLGYRYALSASGHFVGSSILGEFYKNNHALDKSDILAAAKTHFQQFSNMVRPVLAHTPELEGTATDRLLYVLETLTGKPWGMMIFVRTANETHAIITPVFDHPEAIERYMDFMKSNGTRVRGRFVKYVDGTFRCWPRITEFDWPSGGFT